jgi:hypothetical protein
MDAGGKLDLLLVGFRNDLARERVLEFLDGLDPSTPGLAEVDRSLAPPWRLFSGIDESTGRRLSLQLNELGAHVKLIGPQGSEATGKRLQRFVSPVERARPLALFLLLLLLIGVYLNQDRFFGYASTLAGQPKKPPGAPAAVQEFGTEAAVQRLNEQAVALDRKGDYAGAAARLREAMQQQPEQPQLEENLKVVLQNWAVAEFNAGRPELTVKLAEEALQLGEDSRTFSILGTAHARRENWSLARLALERALELGADDPDTLLALAATYRQLGEGERADATLERARERGAASEESNAIHVGEAEHPESESEIE